MLAFIATVAVLNFALGAGLAIAVSHQWSDWRSAISVWTRRSKVVGEVTTEPLSPVEPEATPASSEAIELVLSQNNLDLPPGWQERLTAAGLKPRTVIEATLQVVQLDEESQRRRWLAAETQCRAALKKRDDTVEKALKPLSDEARQWADQVHDFMVQMKELATESEMTRIVAELEHLLGQHIARLEAFVASGKEGEDPETVSRRATHELVGVFEKSCEIRDFSFASLATMPDFQERIADLPAQWMCDRVTGLPNRLGLDSLVGEFTQDGKLLCGAAVQVDRLGKLNERLGIKRTDNVLRAFAKLVESVVHKERGDALVRAAGPTILVLFPDSGLQDSFVATERIRQAIEAATFETQHEEFTLAANCAVAQWQPEESATAFLARLTAGLQAAKQEGRNLTMADEGQGPVYLESPALQVQTQFIAVDMD